MRRSRPSGHQNSTDSENAGYGDEDLEEHLHEDGKQRRLHCWRFISGALGERGRLHCLLFCASFVAALATLTLYKQATYKKHEVAGYAVADPDSCGSDVDKVFNVFEWAVENGAYIHFNISTGTFPIPGTTDGSTVRGLAARGKIQKEDIIFAVPTKLMMSIATLSTDPALSELYNTTVQLHDGFGGLVFYLIHEALNKTSRWRPYLCSLPRHVPLPIFYSPSKLARARAGIPADQREQLDALIESRRDMIEVQYVKVMSPLFARHPARFPPADYTYARWAWASSIVMSRTWGRQFADPVLQRATGQNTSMVHVLVPAADMPNHADPGAHQAAQGPRGVLLLRAAADHAAGDQVLVSYGRKCDAEFLANYGFVPAGNAATACKEGDNGFGNGTAAGNLTQWRAQWRARFARFYASMAAGGRPWLAGGGGGNGTALGPGNESTVDLNATID